MLYTKEKGCEKQNVFYKKSTIVEEFAKKEYKSYILIDFNDASDVVKEISAFLLQHEKRVVLADIETNASFSKFSDTFFWLDNSMIANECFNCTDPNVGLSMNEDRTYLKCYMGDWSGLCD